jgi:flagellin
MSLNVVSNFAANVALRNLAASDDKATSSLAKLSIGSRVVTAKDDAASLAVGSRLNAEVVGLKQAAINAGQAISMLQIADGAMMKINNVLLRMKSLAVQAGSGHLSVSDRNVLNVEYLTLRSEVERNANDTDFAGMQLTNGAIVADRTAAADFEVADGVQDIVFRGDIGTSPNGTIDYDTSGSFSVAIGATTYTGALASDTNDGSSMNTGAVVTLTNAGSTAKIDLIINTAFDVDATRSSGTLGLSGSNTISFSFKIGTGVTATADEITVTINSVDAGALSIASTAIATLADADAATVAVSNAIDDLQGYRANIGASQNRLQFASANISTATENTEAARSQLMDLDVAAEMSFFVSSQILIQAGTSMLAQANQMPINLLTLFQTGSALRGTPLA